MKIASVKMSLQPILEILFCENYATLETEQAPPSGAKIIWTTAGSLRYAKNKTCLDVGS